MRKTGLAAVLCLLLASCASTGSGAFGSGETARKVTRATEYIVFTPLCLLYGICPMMNFSFWGWGFRLP